MLNGNELRTGNKFLSIFGVEETVLSIMDNTDKGRIKVLPPEVYKAGAVIGFASENHKQMYSHLITCWENGNQYKPCEISGVRLTESILTERCRVLKTELSFNIQFHQGAVLKLFRVHENARSNDWFFEVWLQDDCENEALILKRLDFLHELQNIYYLLFKSELIIK